LFIDWDSTIELPTETPFDARPDGIRTHTTSLAFNKIAVGYPKADMVGFEPTTGLPPNGLTVRPLLPLGYMPLLIVSPISQYNYAQVHMLFPGILLMVHTFFTAAIFYLVRNMILFLSQDVC
jgi:hypothetical protein